MPYVIPTYTHWPVTINDATDVAAGVMSAADKAKLDALSETVFIFRPGGVDGENVYTNWATLHTATQNVQGNYVIQVDSTLAPAVVPVGTWDMGARATISPITPTTGNPPDPTNFANRLELADGAILRDVAAFRGPVAVYSNNTSGPALEITGNALTIITEGAHVVHQGTQPVVSLTTPGQSVVFFLNFSAGFDSPTNAPFIFVGSGIQCIFLTSNSVNFSSTNFATGHPAAFLFFLYDASIVPPPSPGFAGTAAFLPSDQSQAVFYDDSIVPPLLGVDNVQAAIDVLKAGGGGGGIGGTIAVNQVAFGTAPNIIGGDARITWTAGTGIFSVNNGLGPFLDVNTVTSVLTVSDPLTPSVSTLTPNEISVTDNVAAQISLKVQSGTPTIDTTVIGVGALDLAVNELQVNGAPGAAGQVLTSQGAGLPPVWGAGGGGTLLTIGEIPGGPVDGLNTVFTTAANYQPNTTAVYVNGVRQLRGVGNDYTESGANQITFTVAPLAGFQLQLDYYPV